MTRTNRIAAPAIVLGALLMGNHPAAADCPSQQAQAVVAMCQASYGATFQFTYPGAANWWFKERVVQGDPHDCQPGEIDQTTNPFQSPNGIIDDLVTNTNGPPANVAPCQHLTHQTIYAGPTQPRVEECQYPNGQLIQVTREPRRVSTSAGGAAISCNY